MNIFKFLLPCFLGLPLFVGAEAFDVGQKNKEFTVTQLKVKAGDEVVFTNQDPFFHNIFSLTVGQSFDLGSYPKGSKRSVILKEKGLIEVECAIHPNMQMTIEVE